MAAATGVRIAPSPVHDGGVVLTTRDGRNHRVSLTAPVTGVLRVRLRGAASPSPRTGILLDVAEQPVELRVHEDDLLFTSWDREGSWSADGAEFRWGALSCSFLPWAQRVPGLPPGPRGPVELDPRWTTHVLLEPDTGLFGGGASVQGPNLRGRTRSCINVNAGGVAGVDASYLNVPLFWSDVGWGVFVNTGSPVIADLGDHHSEIAVLTTYDSDLDLFFLSGEPENMLDQYGALTGLPAPQPDWLLGLWTSRDSYFTAAEVGAVLDRYEEAECPVDVLHVDAWQTGNLFDEQSSNWQVDRERWPPDWSARLRRSGVHLSLWTNPLVHPESPAGADAVGRGLVLRTADGRPAELPDGSSRLVVDFTAPGAQEWWQERIAVLIAEGAEVVKADFGEEVPLDARLHEGIEGWRVRNSYALAYQAATHRATRTWAESQPKTVFCRSGTAGSQRFAVHWVGDTPSTWLGMTSALRACLSLSLSGFAFVGSDVGGFWAPGSMDRCARAFETFDSSAFEADVEPELYVRWVQWGMLSPLMRLHGTGRREPWAYPEPFGEIATAACRLRRMLRQHLARTARDAVTRGRPLMRPMVLAYPRDRAARAAELQYMLGDRLLVAPVLVPGGEIHVWVPDGRWCPLVDDANVELLGPGWTSLKLPLSAVPAWISVPSEHDVWSAEQVRRHFFGGTPTSGGPDCH
ncbi:glycoside hydrolase family 31 protein [Geodermatophilus sp. SYSU D00766]